MIIDSRYYQNLRKQQQKERRANESYSQEVVHWEPIAAWGIIAGCFISIILLGIIGSYVSEDNRNNCEKIDGKYEVVDKKFNGKVYVDVYGCVK